jgi:thiol-disulfide isomerase/thioredoxin
VDYVKAAQQNRQAAQQRTANNTSTADLDSAFEANKLLFIKKNPDDLIAKILNMSQEPNLNGYEPKKINGDIDTPAIAYRYRQQYWQNTDLTDSRLLYSLAFEPKMVRYIEQFVPQTPDSLYAACDFLLKKTKPNPEMYEYMLRKLASMYEQPKIMGTDAVFVYLIEKYFADTKAVPFLSQADLLRIQQKSQALKPALVGNTMPDIALQNEMGQEISVFTLKKDVVVLYFYDPSCGKCQKFTPEILEIYNKYKTNNQLAFVAICNAPEEANWRKYIIDKQLNWINLYDFSGRYLYRYAYDIAQVPRIMIIDKNHKLIGKNLDAVTLDLFLKNQLK